MFVFLNKSEFYFVCDTIMLVNHQFQSDKKSEVNILDYVQSYKTKQSCEELMKKYKELYKHSINKTGL